MRRDVFSFIPALGFSLIPSLSCPACLPALASVLSALGLSFAAERPYLLWLNLLALIAALVMFARRRRTAGYLPLAVASIGAAAIMVGKFLLVNSWIWWSGIAFFIVGSAWATSKQQVTISCAQFPNSTTH